MLSSIRRVYEYVSQVRYVYKFAIPSILASIVAVVYARQQHQLIQLGLGSLVFWFVLSIGCEVGMHRLFSHGAFKTYRIVELVLAFLGTLCCQGSVISWVAVHRGLHHPYADTEKDIHSPIAHGRWASYMGWLFTYDQNTSLRGAIPLMRDKFLLWLHLHQYRIVLCFMAVILAVTGPIGLGSYLIGTVIVAQQNFIVNVMCHGTKLGYRSYSTRCSSRNIGGFLGILSFGLSLHNNHHYNPGSKNFALNSGEFDIGYQVIRLLEKRDARDTRQTNH